MRLLPEKRYQARLAWNQVSLWPIWLIILGVIVFIVIGVMLYRQMNRRVVRVINKERV
jgi:hypothetical protein